MGEPIFKMEWVYRIRWWEHIILTFIPYTMITWEGGIPTYYKIWRGKVWVIGESEAKMIRTIILSIQVWIINSLQKKGMLPIKWYKCELELAKLQARKLYKILNDAPEKTGETDESLRHTE